jgi:hypothetical protein
LGDDLLEGYFGLPIEPASGFGGVAHQMMRFDRSKKFLDHAARPRRPAQVPSVFRI